MSKTENFSVKKDGTANFQDPSMQFSKMTGTWFSASAEFFTNILEATALAARTFKNEMDCGAVTVDHLPGKVLNGFAQSNTAFFRSLSESSEKFNETIRAEQPTATQHTTVEIDYERLAKMVAEELKKTKP